MLDGVYASPSPLARPLFHPAEPLTDHDVEEVVALLHRRILRHLSRSARRRDAQELEHEPDEPLLAELYSASVQGRGVLAERGESRLRPLAHRRDARPRSLPGELCASLDGFSLHAKGVRRIGHAAPSSTPAPKRPAGALVARGHESGLPRHGEASSGAHPAGAASPSPG